MHFTWLHNLSVVVFFFGNFGKLYFVKTEFEHLCHCLQALFFNNITCLFEVYTIFVFMGSFWPQL